MKVFGIGVDVVEIDRIGSLLEQYDQRFAEKVFTEAESTYCEAQRDPRPHYAARFAAKEAVAKAFGTGIGKDLNWTDMEMLLISPLQILMVLNIIFTNIWIRER